MSFLSKRAALVALASLASLLIPSCGASTISSRASTCNGYSELCNKSYGAVTFVGAHNSYAVGVNDLFVNQDQKVTQQLDDGVRMLQMQAHNNNGVITLCHSTCSIQNSGPLEDYLKTVKSWMDGNPNEVVTLLIVNIDNLKASQYDTVFKSAGVDQISYKPQSSPLTASSWPTLGSLIDQETRLVTFLDNAADLSAVPYLIDEFTNMWETEFDVTDVSRFTCSVNRTKGDTASQMFLINHFLDKLVFGSPAPDVDRANVTNSASGSGSLGEHVNTCASSVGRPPNFLLVDFYEFGGGSVFQVAANANGVQYNNKAVASPVPTTSGSGSSPTSSNAAYTLSPRGSTTSAIYTLSLVGTLIGSALTLL